MTWPKGADMVNRLIAAGDLERVHSQLDAF